MRDHNLETDTVWATKVSWGTLGESVWLIPVCAGYDLIRHADVLRPAEHQTIREQLFRPAAQLILKHNIGIHNIQCWHNCAIGTAALMLRDPDLLAFAVDGEVGIKEQIEQGVRAAGLKSCSRIVWCSTGRSTSACRIRSYPAQTGISHTDSPSVPQETFVAHAVSVSRL